MAAAGFWAAAFLGAAERTWGVAVKAKAAMEKHGGMGLALNSAWAWTSGDNLGRAALEKANVRFVPLPESDAAKIKRELKVLDDEWLAKAKEKELPGEEIMKYADAMAQRYKAVKRVNIV